MEANKEKILVVDDEASIRRILETRLSMIGYEVVTAADGEEALDTFRDFLSERGKDEAFRNHRHGSQLTFAIMM